MFYCLTISLLLNLKTISVSLIYFTYYIEISLHFTYRLNACLAMLNKEKYLIALDSFNYNKKPYFLIFFRVLSGLSMKTDEPRILKNIITEPINWVPISIKFT